ncbi:uncharacterized protein [Watersipora subatra]|uniref:uncharacterized protein n=1 Tax=Watersipora subatra TaxID=2589382 RepID=UPI00355C889A
MGSIVTKLSTAFGSPERIMVLGLGGAGKTTVLYRLKFGTALPMVTPTVGFNIETLTPQDGAVFKVWDIGGGSQAKYMWKRCLQQSKGIIYVVDSSDRDRFDESQEELSFLLDSSNSENIPLVVLANKRDLPGSAASTEVAQALALQEYTGRRMWHVQTISATTGDGLEEAIDILCSFIKDSEQRTR